MIIAESIFTTGYAYPEVPAGKTGDALRIFTTQKANQLYGSGVKRPSAMAADVSGASGSLTNIYVSLLYLVNIIHD